MAEYRPDPIDLNDIDGQMGATATPMDWPEGLSEEAKKGLRYLEGAAFLFHYRSRYIVTDESGWLTVYGTGKPGDPLGFPQADFDSVDEIGPWLEAVAEYCDEDGEE